MKLPALVLIFALAFIAGTAEGELKCYHCEGDEDCKELTNSKLLPCLTEEATTLVPPDTSSEASMPITTTTPQTTTADTTRPTAPGTTPTTTNDIPSSTTDGVPPSTTAGVPPSTTEGVPPSSGVGTTPSTSVGTTPTTIGTSTRSTPVPETTTTTPEEATTATTTAPPEANGNLNENTEPGSADDLTDSNRNVLPSAAALLVRRYRSISRGLRVDDTANACYYIQTSNGPKRGCVVIPTDKSGCAAVREQNNLPANPDDKCRVCLEDGCNRSGGGRFTISFVVLLFTLVNKCLL